MTPLEYALFGGVCGAAFVRYCERPGHVAGTGDPSEDQAVNAADDDAAVLAANLACRAVEAMRRIRVLP